MRFNCSNDFACLAFILSFNDCFKVHISYFKDFDRNFQNNYYFVLFPSIQFLNNSNQQQLIFCPRLTRQPTYNTISILLSQAFFRDFLKIFLSFFHLQNIVCFFILNTIFCVARFFKSLEFFLRFCPWFLLPSQSEQKQLYSKLNLKSNIFSMFFKLFLIFLKIVEICRIWLFLLPFLLVFSFLGNFCFSFSVFLYIIFIYYIYCLVNHICFYKH